MLVVAQVSLYFYFLLFDRAELTGSQALVTEVAAWADSSNLTKLVAIVWFEIKCILRAALEALSASNTFFFYNVNSHLYSLLLLDCMLALKLDQ